MDDVGAEGTNRPPQGAQGAKIGDGSHCAHQRRNRKTLEVFDSIRLIVQEIAAAPRQGDVETPAVEVPCGVENHPLSAAELEPGNHQQDPDGISSSCHDSP